MVRYTFALALIIGTAQSACPLLDPESFRETLNNHRKEIVVDGVPYKIMDRKKPDYAIESPHKPKIEIREKNKRSREICDYTRRIGDKKFGSFRLKEKHKKPLLVLTDKYDPYRHHWGEYRDSGDYHSKRVIVID